MRPLILSLLVTIGGCAARQPVDPRTRTYAVTRFLQGASEQDIAGELSMSSPEAREVLRAGLRDLNRRYYRRR